MVSRTLAAITPSDDDKTKTPTPSDKETTTPPPSAKDTQKLSVEESLYLATLGGAHALKLSSKIGAFDLGMDFDAQLITLSSPSLPPPSPPTPTPTTLFPTQSSAHPHPSPTATATNKLSDAFTALSETPSTAPAPSVSGTPAAAPAAAIAPPPPTTHSQTDNGLVDLWGTETWGEKVAKWVFCGDDRNTRRVFVRGRLVHDRA